jgi:hypothetical protein
VNTHTEVKTAYVAIFMKTLKITDPGGRRFNAPVLKAPEKVVLR